MKEYTKTGSFGKFYYKNKGRTILHREDGPAIEYADGDREWYLNGQRHREDGPAIEWSSGDSEWFLNDKRHRMDGPAVEWVGGDKSWWINDEFIFEIDINGNIVDRME